jgi:hypothetical protein
LGVFITQDARRFGYTKGFFACTLAFGTKVRTDTSANKSAYQCAARDRCSKTRRAAYFSTSDSASRCAQRVYSPRSEGSRHAGFDFRSFVFVRYVRRFLWRTAASNVFK